MGRPTHALNALRDHNATHGVQLPLHSDGTCWSGWLTLEVNSAA